MSSAPDPLSIPLFTVPRDQRDAPGVIIEIYMQRFHNHEHCCEQCSWFQHVINSTTLSEYNTIPYIIGDNQKSVTSGYPISKQDGSYSNPRTIRKIWYINFLNHHNLIIGTTNDQGNPLLLLWTTNKWNAFLLIEKSNFGIWKTSFIRSRAAQNFIKILLIPALPELHIFVCRSNG